MGVDATVIGGGTRTRASADALMRAGATVRHSFFLDDDDRSPVILGDVPNAYTVARSALDAGRHLLVTSPAAMSPEKLSTLIEGRRRSQAVFLWNERRFHPGYRFVSGLIETDAAWRPRFLRHDTLTTDAVSGPLMRWLALEALALIESLTDASPLTVAATSARSAIRNAPHFLSLNMVFAELAALVNVGAGEAFNRRETVIAGEDCQAHLDELNPFAPVSVVDGRRTERGEAPRTVTYPPHVAGELARAQCVAFLEGTMKQSLAQEEASVWRRALALVSAMDASSQQGGTAVDVTFPTHERRFRLVTGFLGRESSATI